MPAPAPQGSNPAPVQPGVAAPRPTRLPERDSQPLQAGDVICGQCGVGNKPARKFCRRCGHDLVDATVVKVPWWRRLFARRPKAVREAGSRPRRLRTPGRSAFGLPRRLITMLVVIGIIGGGGYFARSYVRGASDMVLDRVKGTEPVNPTAMTASSSGKGHGPGLARDGGTDTYWAPAKGGSGKGEFLITKFGEPFRLVYVLITPGVHGEKEEAYLRAGRPKELRLVLTSKDGSNRVKNIDLDDKLGSDQFHVTGNNITQVKLEIVSSYPGSVPGSHTAITEVEFHTRK